MPNRTLPSSWVVRTTRGLLSVLVMMLPLLALNSCATTKAPSDSPLTGHWLLDPKASDDEHSIVTQAVSRAQQRMRRRFRAAGGQLEGAGAGAGGGPGAAGTGQGNEDQTLESAGDVLGNGVTIGPDFQQLRTRLQQTLATPRTLYLQIQPDVVAIQSDSLPPREYQAEQSTTEFNEYGAARLDTHWSGQAFEVRQRYTSGARLIERYEVDPSGALIYTRLLQDPTVGKLTVRGVYHRRR